MSRADRHEGKPLIRLTDAKIEEKLKPYLDANDEVAVRIGRSLLQNGHTEEFEQFASLRTPQPSKTMSDET